MSSIADLSRIDCLQDRLATQHFAKYHRGMTIFVWDRVHEIDGGQAASDQFVKQRKHTFWQVDLISCWRLLLHQQETMHVHGNSRHHSQ